MSYWREKIGTTLDGMNIKLHFIVDRNLFVTRVCSIKIRCNLTKPCESNIYFAKGISA